MSRRVSASPGSRWLIIGGWLSIAASLLHIGCILGGPDWFRFFGAPEQSIQAYERGDPSLVYMTICIAGILAIWAAYAFSGAGRLPRLPLLRTGLVVISAIYLLRGLALVPLHLWKPELTDAFTVWSSLIVLVYGVAYAVGTWRAWNALSAKSC